MDKKIKFIETILPDAKMISRVYNIPLLFILAQSALETGYNLNVPGSNFFGIKAGRKWTGKKQLLTTTEYHNDANVDYPVIINIEKLSNGMYKYTVKDYFRVYESIKDSLIDYAKLITNNYTSALKYKHPKTFAREIGRLGYATASNYSDAIVRLIDEIEPLIKKKMT